ncbi:fatty-acid amide hydrolase 2-A-like isoform X1 [Osmia bicornis bicornis]|uniref:fatty-acid amide hydrolase 2-A-like isoform X1 n=1 Tax=Osmia bicornis bicornis TaxID=1437191 RepID=UPI0010F7F25D|nr:fatty-acid amide hydrolase 2-A-like isoform X1 [Osmia bicornis bicornis]XP_029052216.1 fatty-acid amide hydrolase 2-A-like isoform X1 [Osmia bicornis bicornis]XP_029052217.1 fatty-acid amide hydrolase 2-A-like isoform X1 [Osmia bicornis bicornis]
MELLLCALPLVYTKIMVHRWDTVILIVQKILKFLLFLLYCLVTPFLMLQCLKKRKRLPPINSHVLLLSATEIARRIRNRKISSEEVVRAYVKRCKDVNPILNAIVVSRFDAAIQEARKVDEFLLSSRKSEEELAREMPLLGVPMTVKESIAVQGMSYSVGVKKKIPDKASQDATVVKMVREAGAIILLVSNTPELCLFWESNNKVTGPTWNPYDTTKVAGGSSGGEAALLGSGASILSLSSDIAGSARLPAMFCGIFGHKPTACLVSCKGHKPDSNDRNWPYYFTIGTMVRYAEDLSLMMKIISQSEEARNRFDQKVSLKDMKFFYLEDCCGITNSIDKEMKGAIQSLRKHLEMSCGITVQKAQLNDMKFAFDIATHLLLEMEVDGITEEVKAVGTSKILLELLKCFFFASSHSLPLITYGLLKWVSSKFPNSYRSKMVDKKMALKKQFEDLLGDNGVLIYPTYVTPAHYHHQSYPKVANFTYMMIYNVLGLPVTQCPMGLNSKGLPIGLQIVANAGNDHLTIAVAQRIEKAFGGWQEPPTTEVSI